MKSVNVMILLIKIVKKFYIQKRLKVFCNKNLLKLVKKLLLIVKRVLMILIKYWINQKGKLNKYKNYYRRRRENQNLNKKKIYQLIINNNSKRIKIVKIIWVVKIIKEMVKIIKKMVKIIKKIVKIIKIIVKII